MRRTACIKYTTHLHTKTKLGSVDSNIHKESIYHGLYLRLACIKVSKVQGEDCEQGARRWSDPLGAVAPVCPEIKLKE